MKHIKIFLTFKKRTSKKSKRWKKVKIQFSPNARKYFNTIHRNKSKEKEKNKSSIRIRINQILTGTIMKLCRQLSLKACRKRIKTLWLTLTENKLNWFKVHILQKEWRRWSYLLQRRRKFCNNAISVETIFLHLRWQSIWKHVLDRRKGQVQWNQIWRRIMTRLTFVGICKVWAQRDLTFSEEMVQRFHENRTNSKRDRRSSGTVRPQTCPEPLQVLRWWITNRRE